MWTAQPRWRLCLQVQIHTIYLSLRVYAVLYFLILPNMWHTNNKNFIVHFAHYQNMVSSLSSSNVWYVEGGGGGQRKTTQKNGRITKPPTATKTAKVQRKGHVKCDSIHQNKQTSSTCTTGASPPEAQGVPSGNQTGRTTDQPRPFRVDHL